MDFHVGFTKQPRAPGFFMRKQRVHHKQQRQRRDRFNDPDVYRG
jgi:hypothetical protein